MDNAFTPRPFAGFTTADLRKRVATATGEKAGKMAAEIERREKVAAGNVEVMTAAERLRFAKTGNAG